MTTNAKVFAGDTSLFSVVNDVNTSANDDVDNDHEFQWKMSFNPDLSKQAQKVIFSLSNLFSKKLGCHITFQINISRSPQ